MLSGVVNLFLGVFYNEVRPKKALAKFVPAAAVTRIERVLFIGTRRKGLQGGLKHVK